MTDMFCRLVSHLYRKNIFQFIIAKDKRMKRFKMVLLWILSILFCLNIYKDGHSMYYHYQNNDGWGFNCESYRGETTTKWWNFYDSEKWRYVGTRKIFDKQSETRKLFIAMILGLSAFLTIRTNRKTTNKKVNSGASFTLTNHARRKTSWYTKTKRIQRVTTTD